MLSPEDIEFIRDHCNDDSAKLLFSAHKYPHINIKLIASTIDGRKKMALKVPEWGERFDLCYPSSVSVEQCSSSYTAKYKSVFFEGRDVLDITGGLGVDSYYISQVAKSIVYIERNPELFETVKYNFGRLGVKNAEFINAETKGESDLKILTEGKVYAVFADPSRRGPSDNRIFNPGDYEPDMSKLLNPLLKIADKIVIKVSPMSDITALIKSFSSVSEILIVSVLNECKEILIIIRKEQEIHPISPGNVKLVAADFDKRKKQWSSFEWNIMEEQESKTNISTPKRGDYLYEPNSSLLKGGAFKLLSNRYSAGKISINSHLYSSPVQITDFPGRSFLIEEIFEFDKRGIKEICQRYPKANVSTRNFPLSPPDLKEKLGIKDGGETFLFGTLFNDNSRKIVVCKKTL